MGIHVETRDGSGRDGSGRVGSGRVGSGRVGKIAAGFLIERVQLDWSKLR